MEALVDHSSFELSNLSSASSLQSQQTAVATPLRHPSRRSSGTMKATARKTNKYFQMKILRPVQHAGHGNKFHCIGNMYLHYINGTLIRQLEVFLDGATPPRWVVRRSDPHSPQLYSISIEVVTRVRTMQINAMHFAAMWMKHVEKGGYISAVELSAECVNSVHSCDATGQQSAVMTPLVSSLDAQSQISICTASTTSTLSRTSQSDGYSDVNLTETNSAGEFNQAAISIPLRPLKVGMYPMPVAPVQEGRSGRRSISSWSRTRLMKTSA